MQKEDEMIDLGRLSDEDSLKFELKLGNYLMGISRLPDDPAVRAAVKALGLKIDEDSVKA